MTAGSSAALRNDNKGKPDTQLCIALDEAGRQRRLGLADFGGVGFQEDWGERQVEVGLRVGVGGVEVGDGGIEKFGEGKVGFVDAVDHAAGEFVGAVIVEVGGVGDVALDSWVAAGRELHEGVIGSSGAHGFKHGFGHVVEVDERDSGVFGDLA